MFQLQQADKVLYCLHQRQKHMVSEARAKWGEDCAYVMASKIVHEQLRLNDLLEEYSQVLSASDPKVALKHLDASFTTGKDDIAVHTKKSGVWQNSQSPSLAQFNPNAFDAVTRRHQPPTNSQSQNLDTALPPAMKDSSLTLLPNYKQHEEKVTSKLQKNDKRAAVEKRKCDDDEAPQLNSNSSGGNNEDIDTTVDEGTRKSSRNRVPSTKVLENADEDDYSE